LTSRVTFLQGLFNWLASVALQFTIRQPEESEAAHHMNLHIASWLITMILVIVQFYNDHITFYRSCKYRLVLRCCTRSMVAIVLSKHSHQASCFVVSTDGWMLWTYVVVAFKRYVWRWPIRPMTLLTVPSMAVSICKYELTGPWFACLLLWYRLKAYTPTLCAVLGFNAFKAKPGITKQEEDEENGAGI